MSTRMYWQAINDALADALDADPAVVLFGEDVGRPGGIFGVTRNLQKRFGPDRVWDTPISEAALVGAALGASLRGLRPVLELMFMDFALVAADQIVNHVAKQVYFSGRPAPLTIRTQQGRIPGSSAQHSQSLEAVFAHATDLHLYLPATPSDAYWLLLKAIRDDEPTLVVEHRGLYRQQGEIAPDGPDLEPGRARTVRSGSDVTIVTWSAALTRAEAVADRLATGGVQAEVIDLRTLRPLDLDSVLDSVGRTGHLAVMHEAGRTGGFGAEVAAQVAESVRAELGVVMQRFAANDGAVPAAPALQARHEPSVDEVAVAIARAGNDRRLRAAR